MCFLIFNVDMSDPSVVSFRVHFGGKFVNTPRKRYIDEKLGFYYDFDKDYVSYFEIEGIVENFGYSIWDQLFYLLPHKPIQIGVRPLGDDKDCIEMLACYEGKKWIDICVQSTQSMGQSQGGQSVIPQIPSTANRGLHGIECVTDNEADNEEEDDSEQEDDYDQEEEQVANKDDEQEKEGNIEEEESEKDDEQVIDKEPKKGSMDQQQYDDYEIYFTVHQVKMRIYWM